LIDFSIVQLALDLLVRIYQMVSKELFYGCNNGFFDFRWALCHPNGAIGQLLSIGLQPFAVEKQACKQGRYGTSLVAILKWMVLNHEVEEDTGYC
jgi:hypothetical protein